MPRVSIIIPIHNSGDYIAECLASIERQTLRDIEVLCLDDASTDDSAAVCRAFAESDDRFKLIEIDENIGVSATRNKGIDLARGEFLLFMDSDDWYPYDYTVEHLYRAAVDHGARIAGGEMCEIDAETGFAKTDYREDGHLALYNFDEEGMIDYRDWQGDFGFTRFIYEKSLIEDNAIRFPDLIRHEDPVFFVKAMIAAGRFYALPEVVYSYRINYKPFELSAQAVDDAVEAHAELLALAQQHGLDTLKGYVVESLRWYLTEHSPEVKQRIAEIYDSWTYRLGSVLIAPYHGAVNAVNRLRGED